MTAKHFFSYFGNAEYQQQQQQQDSQPQQSLLFECTCNNGKSDIEKYINQGW
jgi:hypothetical protein